MSLRADFLEFLDVLDDPNAIQGPSGTKMTFADDSLGIHIEVDIETRTAKFTTDGGTTWEEVKVGEHRSKTPTASTKPFDYITR
jgi:hypothetical protein